MHLSRPIINVRTILWIQDKQSDYTQGTANAMHYWKLWHFGSEPLGYDGG